MKSITGLGLALCVVFGCLLLALIAELYYLLWWNKKKKTDQEEEEQSGTQIPQKRSIFSHIFNLPFIKSTNDLVHEPQPSNTSNKDPWLSAPFAEDHTGDFPRFLFTITEETREDLESEDGVFKNMKVSTSRSNLSDLLQILETPFLTPLASPPYFTPPLTPPFCDLNLELNRIRASPPPVFENDHENGGGDEVNGRFITLVIDEKQDEIFSRNYCSRKIWSVSHQDAHHTGSS